MVPRRSVASARCPFHMLIEVDVETGEQVNPSCRNNRETTQQSLLVWPDAIRPWVGSSTTPPPPLADGCTPTSNQPPRIQTPKPNAIALLIPGLPADRQEIPLEATSDTKNSRLDWFVDGEWLGSSLPTERLWWTPTTGHHEVVVMDESGRADRIQLEVRAGS